jgi:hypothetical protein
MESARAAREADHHLQRLRGLRFQGRRDLAVELRKAFINADKFSHTRLGWRVGIDIAFVVRGPLFAVTDRLHKVNGAPR